MLVGTGGLGELTWRDEGNKECAIDPLPGSAQYRSLG